MMTLTGSQKAIATATITLSSEDVHPRKILGSLLSRSASKRSVVIGRS